jgi:hypothetical protein
VAAVDHYGPVARQQRIELEHQCARIDRATVALILEVIEAKGIDLPSDLWRTKACGAEATLGQLLAQSFGGCRYVAYQAKISHRKSADCRTVSIAVQDARRGRKKFAVSGRPVV